MKNNKVFHNSNVPVNIVISNSKNEFKNESSFQEIRAHRDLKLKRDNISKYDP